MWQSTFKGFSERENKASKGKLEIILNLGVTQTTAKTEKNVNFFFKFKRKKMRRKYILTS